MKQKYPVLFFISLLAGSIIYLSSCKKLNEATELGGDLLPPIDNISTFDTIITVEGYNYITDGARDSIYSSPVDEHFLGRIDNDPLFGKTEAQLSLQLKPAAYPFKFINVKDSLHLDSIVLALDYVETYGDSVGAQTISVYEVGQSSDFTQTSNYQIREDKVVRAGLLGSASVIPQRLKDSIAIYKDTVARQIRIKLNNSLGNRLLALDTSSGGGYESDSSFATKFKGFTLASSGGNALFGINLNGAKTRLEIYYKDDNNDAPVANWDTAVARFTFVSGSAASANYVKRDYTGTPLQAALGGIAPDNLLYIQSTPGTFVSLRVPALSTISNRVIHRAELIAEQSFSTSNSLFTPPTYLYLDAFDAGINKYRTIPYDVSYDVSAGFNLAAFGVSPYNGTDGSGNTVKQWRFNITRYVQHVVNKTAPAFDLRITAPFYLIDEAFNPALTGNDIVYPAFPVSATGIVSPLNPAIAKGRVALVGNSGVGDSNPHRLRLRLVYSKL